MAEEPAHKLARHQRLGKYEILDFVASGGMGTIYTARNVDLHRVVALKLLTPILAKQPLMLDRFRREARISARLHHENIVSIYEFGEHDGAYYLALEYVPGTDLQDYIEKKGMVRPETARQITLQIARALGNAHEHGIVHRDVKPSNILLTKKDGRIIAKLTDLGLAIQLHNEDDFRLTRIGTTVGTVDYMSPEQARKSEDADIRSDIYSLGCTFYHMLTGIAPFAKGNLTERLVQHMEAEPLDVRTINKDTPEELVLILKRMLAKKPDERYQTPQELLRDLERPERLKKPEKAAPQPAKGSPRPAIPQGRLVEPPDSPDELSARRAPRKRQSSNDALETRATRDDSSVDVLETRKDKPLSSRSVRPGSKAGAKGPNTTGWLLGVGGVGLLLAVVIAIALAPPRTIEKPVEPPIRPGIALIPDIAPPPIVPEVAPNGKKEDPKQSSIVRPLPGQDVEALRREFFGPFLAAAPQAKDARVVRVSRAAAPGPASFRTLAEALAKSDAGATTIIEIHDEGPLFVPALSPLTDRNLVLRAGAKHRPLVVWDRPRLGNNEKALDTFLSLEKGRLTLEGLDVVVRWTDAQAGKPASLFHLRKGHFEARDCTFTLAGRHPHGIALVHIDGAAKDSPSTETDPATVRLTRCYARGNDLTLLALRGTAAEVLFDDALAVGGHRPLIALVGRPEDAVTLRAVRSTLAAGRNLLSWQPLGTKSNSPRLHALLWDSILTRNDPEAVDGDLVHLHDSGPDQLKWKTFNSVYAGWKRLLASDTRTIAGNELRSWREMLGHNDGDRSLDETWPRNAPGQLEDLPAIALHPAEGPLGFPASVGVGVIGCDVQALPPEPRAWLERTYERRFLASPAVEGEGIPEIEPETDGFYHGERIEFNAKTDLGQLLAARLKTKRPAARVVLHLAGRGEFPVSPLRVQNIEQLVLFFEPPKDGKSEPLTLTVNPKQVGDQSALIEVDKGSLELINARLRYENTRFAVAPPYLIRVQGGDLSLRRCLLHGPLDRGPDHHKALIAFVGAGTQATRAFGLTLNENVLLGKGLLHLQDAGIQLRARNNLGFALGDAVQLDLGPLPTPKPNVTCLFDNNTWALRQAFLNVRLSANQPSTLEPIQVQATANYFPTPFDEPSQAVLLRCPEAAIARGALLWQGKGNALSPRMHAYFGLPGSPLEKQSLKDWLQLWGAAGEPDALLVEPAKGSATIATDATQLDRLILPREVSPEPGNAIPGADLSRLGIQKKKG